MAGVGNHDYHLVEPSKWPAIGALSAFMMAFGGIFSLHDYVWGSYLFFAGVAGILYTFFGWFKDVAMEGEGGLHTPTVQIGLRYGMILFICSEVMFFVAWFWAFFNASIFPVDLPAVGGVWPPVGIETFDPWHIPFVNTLVLLLSGTTVTWAHHALLGGDRKGLKRGLRATVALGILFTSLQAYEYYHAGFGFAGNIYGSTFYMATGFHGFHVIVGTIFLAVCLWRAHLGHFKPNQHFGFEAAAWYWHFVDVVWLFLFTSIYWWGSGG